MSLQPKCSNCGKEISVPGHVFAIFYPFLFLFLGFSGGQFCEPCASGINLIGFYAAFVGAVGLMVWAFWYFGA